MEEASKKRDIGRHACERCRKAKVRCNSDHFAEQGKCRRCHELGKGCEWKEISKTRKRTRTVARVADLENQLRQMSTTVQTLTTKVDNSDLKASREPSYLEPDNVPTTVKSNGSMHTRTPGVNPPSTQDTPFRSSGPFITASQSSSHCIISRLYEDLPMYQFDEGRRSNLMHTYIQKLHPLYPILACSSMSDSALQTYRPFTANAMVTAACIIQEPMLFTTSHQKASQLVIEAILLRGEKTLDLVQALLIMATWTDMPEEISRSPLYQWTEMAYTMIVEIGFVGLASQRATERQLLVMTEEVVRGDKEKLWTILAVLLCCSRIQIGYHRRGHSLREHSAEFLSLFERCATSEDEHRFLAWYRLQVLAEDIEHMKRRTDTNHHSITDEYDYNTFSNDLRHWEVNFRDQVVDVSLGIELGFCRSKLHELTLISEYGDHRHLELASLSTRSGDLVNAANATLNPAYVRSILGFVEGCHYQLDRVLQTDVEMMRALPLLSVLRVPYAFKALAMLEQRADKTNSSLSKVIDRDTLKWLPYARSVSKMLEESSSNGTYVAPSVALRIRNQAADHARLQGDDSHDKAVAPDVLEDTVVDFDPCPSFIGPYDSAYETFVDDMPGFGFSPDLWDFFTFGNNQLSA